MLLCFAKNVITLSEAIYILILLLTVLLTIVPTKEPIMKWRSREERCGASAPTTNLRRFNASM